MSTTVPLVSGRARILAVDDNPAALYGTARVLRAAGYEVIEATTGTSALEKARLADLIVLDINLPDIDGFEVCRQLRARPETAAVPVLHLSASFTDSSDQAVGLASGADSYLTRPVEPPVLIAAVRTLLFAHQADRVRRGADAKLRTMFDLAPIAIAVLDQKYRFESVNPAYVALTGFDPLDLIGKELVDFIATPDDPVGAGGRWLGQLALKRKNGSSVDVECRLAKEAISGASILVASDITQRLQLELDRENLLSSERAARAAAERSDRLKDEFLATLSHELRNPINAIMGWSTVISRIAGLPPTVMQGVQAIERNSKLQAQMIADLLDYAGITFGKMRMVATTIDPYPVVRAALEVTRDAAAAQSVDVDVTLDGAAVYVDADPARLQQIVWNLLSNAIKFSPKAGRINVSAGVRGANFCLTVKDQGIGISPEFLPRIFERFSQQNASDSRSFQGLGLGLAIVKQLVDLHGGSIEALSDGQGKGATFKVLLPLSQADLPDRLSESQILRTQDLTGVVALVVEDDMDARELTKRILTDAGATVIEVASARAALDCVDKVNANILISDISMAEQDGYALLRELRSRGFGPTVLPAMALTAYARMQDRIKAISSGFQDHMVKPLDPQALIARVAALHRAPTRRT